VRAYVGLGSNVGDRLGKLRAATRALEERDGISVTSVSGVYETDPVGPAQPDFLNAVVEIETDVAAEELLRIFKDIEADLGRVVRERWGPREIDLDLLVYGNAQIDSDDLVVPHPQIATRVFVLAPLVEIAPALEIAGVGPASALLARLDRSGVRIFGGSGLLRD
jgi:2-amino-4-hydroxy-6-hydroxymethyldihydropteridine diphosphokinase